MRLRYNDAVHGYWLDGKRTKSVTAVTGLPDDKYNLNEWAKRQVAIGLAKTPELLGSVDVDDNDKGEGNKLTAEAMRLAGSSEAADYGTHAHKVTEDGDRGLELTGEDLWIHEAWCHLLDLAGLEIVPELIEGVVVFPEQLICGRFDRIARRRSDNAAAVVDLKTGDSAIDYPHSTTVQLAMYANAPLRCDIGPEADGDTETFFEMPTNIDKNVGYVIHIPRDGKAGVYRVNLKLGWACAQQIIFPALRWRKIPHSSLLEKVTA